MTTDRKSVSLVLGSGGARGLAHIGVIQWLEENGYEIKSISGCSMGALIGGIYAAGKLDTFEQWVRSITKLEIVALLDLSWGKSGLVKGDKIINTLVDLVGNQKIEDLPVSFTAVAVDIKHEKEIWINSGRLFDAIRASISLPLFFTPFDYHGSLLIDGGVLNPVPIAPTFGDYTDLTIAVNLGGPPAEIDNHQVGISEIPPVQDSLIQQNINHFIKSLQQSATKSTAGKDWDVYDVAMQAFEAMQSTIARAKLAAYPPDLTINIARNVCRTLEFDRADEMIKLGYSKIRQVLS
ncbi:MAG: patatin-like phospholipase family protein [Arenicellales bacterium]